MNADIKAPNEHDEYIVNGKLQQIWWEILKKGHVLPSPVWQSKYPNEILQSLNNMIKRARDYGYIIERLPGERGGETHATYRLVRLPDGTQIEHHLKRIQKVGKSELVPDAY